MLQSCIQHHDPERFDLEVISKLSAELETLKTGFVPIGEWPSALRRLNPESVRKVNIGVYVQLESFLFEESGLFLSFDNPIPDDPDAPSYVLLGRNIYSYYKQA